MRSLTFVLVCSIASAPVAAQTIDPGMTREQVIAKLGEPLSMHSYQGHSYLLYKNGCERTCGMNDLVVLDSGKVVDAVFRAPGRKYSGTSSSPRMISAADARRGPEGTPAPLVVPKTPPKTPAKAAAPAPAKKPTGVPAKPVAPPPATKTVQPPAKKPPATPAPVKKPSTAS